MPTLERLDWLPNPPAGTAVCGGFDGSLRDDWTAIRLETWEGFQFTPRWPETGEPMIWNPGQHGGRIPRDRVDDAWEILVETYSVERVYCDPGFMDPNDPTSWKTEIETWANRWGEKTFVPWQMAGSQRHQVVHAALVRFETDLALRAFTHDGCPITEAHALNARKLPRPGDRFALGKPSQHQKIDALVTSVLAHEAASDARAGGWQPPRRGRVRVLRR
jgi:hypothetical protein